VIREFRNRNMDPMHSKIEKIELKRGSRNRKMQRLKKIVI